MLFSHIFSYTVIKKKEKKVSFSYGKKQTTKKPEQTNKKTWQLWLPEFYCNKYSTISSIIIVKGYYFLTMGKMPSHHIINMIFFITQQTAYFSIIKTCIYTVKYTITVKSTE